MSPSATNPALTQSGEYPNFFRTIASDDAQRRLKSTSPWIFLKLNKIAVLHDKGDYGKGLAEFAKGFLEADPRAEVVLYEGITPGAVDYSPWSRNSNGPTPRPLSSAAIIRKPRSLFSKCAIRVWTPVFISDDGVKDDTFIKVAGEFAEGVYATGPVDTSKNPIAIEAVEMHKKEYGEEPGAFYLNAYAATLALLNAIEKSNSTDYDVLTKTLRSEWVGHPPGHHQVR